ncbi:MAG: hypothetical protein AAF824_02770 [Bacteroidota bacterium]
MAKFLATHGLSYLLEGIIIDAKTSLTIVSRHFRLDDHSWTLIQQAEKRQIDIKIVFSTYDLSFEQHSFLADSPSINTFLHPQLNANCFYNENWMAMGSMFLHDTQHKPLRELGMMLSAEGDHLLFRQVKLEVASIIQEASPLSSFKGESLILN